VLKENVYPYLVKFVNTAVGGNDPQWDTTALDLISLSRPCFGHCMVVRWLFSG
jgi:hypothetical protein